MLFKGIHHLVIRVNDLDQSIAHWMENFGLALSRRQSNEDLGVRQAIFDLDDGGFIELVAPLNSSSALAGILSRHGEGVHLVSMRVESLTGAVAECAAKSVTVVGADGGPNFIHPKSASGVMLGLYADE
ncbi:MAG: VOC family protein [bacterium]